MTNPRITKYETLLRQKYGSRVFDALFRVNYENNTLSSIKDKIALNKFIIEYKRNNEGCKNPKCKNLFNKKNLLFSERPMEIPGSLKTLNFNDEDRSTLIMMVGEAAGPTISTHLNLSYGLLNLYINDDGSWDKEKNDQIFSQLEKTVSDKGLSNLRFPTITNWKSYSRAKKLEKYRKSIEKHNLWTYLAEIFGKSFPFVKENLYLTDLSKCNDKENKIWRSCFKECINFLYEEIQLIKPLLIIFLGRTSQKEFKKLLKKKREKVFAGKLNGKEVNLEKYYDEDFKALRFFKSFRVGDLPVFMINIYHNSFLTNNRNSKEKVERYLLQCKRFIQEIAIPVIKK